MLSGRVSTILVFIIIAVIAFLAGYYSVDITGIEDRSYASGYDDAWVKASGIVENSSLFPRTPDEMYSISGEIKSVSGNMFTIEAYPVSLNPLLDDSKTTIRQVTITKDTEIVRQIPKIPQEINEMIKDGGTVSLFSEEIISVEQLIAGFSILVVSDKDIKHETDIVALKIVLN